MRVKIDNKHHSCKSILYSDRFEMVNHIIKECSKLALKEYKNRNECIGHVINREFGKRLKFGRCTN